MPKQIQGQNKTPTIVYFRLNWGLGGLPRHFDGDLAVLGDLSFRARAVALIELARGVVCALGVAQVMIQFPAHGTLGQRLREGCHEVVKFLGTDGSIDQLLHHPGGQSRQRP
jgi:hypothetical protein